MGISDTEDCQFINEIFITLLIWYKVSLRFSQFLLSSILNCPIIPNWHLPQHRRKLNTNNIIIKYKWTYHAISCHFVKTYSALHIQLNLPCHFLSFRQDLLRVTDYQWTVLVVSTILYLILFDLFWYYGDCNIEAFFFFPTS